MDLTLMIDEEQQRVLTKVYRKAMYTDLYINARSNHPMSVKLGTLKGLVCRAHRYCDRKEDLQVELKHLENTFVNLPACCKVD